MRKIYRLGNRGKVLVPHSVHQGIAYAGGKNKCVGSSPSDTLVRVSKGSFHEKQSAMPCPAGVSGNVPEEKIKRSALKRKAEQNTRLIYLYNYSLAVGVWNTTAPYFRFSCSIKCVRFNPQIYPTVFHTPLALEINLIILVFICFLFLRLINNLPTFKRTSLIEISRETNSAHGGSRFKLTKRTKIDCSL